VRHRLRSKRKGETYELVIGGQKVYLRTGRYEDGSLGELFVDLAKQGSTLGSLGSMFAIAVSLGLQHGVPLSEFVSAFTRQKFEPAGVVRGHDNVKMANSFIDAVFRVLAVDYLGDYELAQVKLDSANGKTGGNGHATATQSVVSTGPICTKCGDATTRTGTCYACLSCGTSSGGCS
jgi:ribonucleoside-diphosphate reductase alpha chain